MKEKRKGFTLIELLAVIVILAIIALIATPIVLNIIKSVKKGAYARSIEGVLKASKYYYAESLIDVKPPKDIEFICSKNKCVNEDSSIKDLEIDGNIGDGKVTIGKDGKISLIISNNNYCAYKYAGSDEIFIINGTCEENNVEIIHDATNPVITKKDEIVTSHTITINYEAIDDIGIKEVLYSYGESQNKLDKQGNCSDNSCIMDTLQSSKEYYYKICAVDTSLNKSNPCITGNTKTKTSIEGTPIITAQWPSTTSIKVDVSGITIDSSDTISYRYSINGEVKQDWTTDSSYTYTNLTEGTSNEVLIETKATNSGDLGNSKEATIYTSKTVTDTNNGYTTNNLCTKSTKIIEATDIYNSITLTSPTCTSYTETQSKYCSTTKGTYGSCSSTRTCTLSGGSGKVPLIDETEDEECSWETDQSCVDSCYDDADDNVDCILENDPSDCDVGIKDIENVYNSCVSDCDYEDCDTYTTCEYGGYIDVNTTLYKATYSGIVKPKTQTY